MARKRATRGGGRTRAAATRNRRRHHRVEVKARTAAQKEYIAAIRSSDITICIGPAGTGKTAVAVGVGLQYVTADSPAHDRLVVMRPVKEACEERMGALPGDLTTKMSPWAAPVLDNMRLFAEQAQVKNLAYQRRMEVVPLAYARGRSLNDSFIILDEAQNCTPSQMLMVLTRLGDRSRLVINGDTSQSDLARGAPSGLLDAIERIGDMNGVSVVKFDEEDVVRNPIISEIIRRYAD